MGRGIFTPWNGIVAYTVLVYIFTFAPIVVVLMLSFNDSMFGSFPITGVSLRWFYELAENDAIIRAFKTSLLLGSLTAIIATVIGIGVTSANIQLNFLTSGVTVP